MNQQDPKQEIFILDLDKTILEEGHDYESQTNVRYPELLKKLYEEVKKKPNAKIVILSASTEAKKYAQNLITNCFGEAALDDYSTKNMNFDHLNLDKTKTISFITPDNIMHSASMHGNKGACINHIISGLGLDNHNTKVHFFDDNQNNLDSAVKNSKKHQYTLENYKIESAIDLSESIMKCVPEIKMEIDKNKIFYGDKSIIMKVMGSLCDAFHIVCPRTIKDMAQHLVSKIDSIKKEGKHVAIEKNNNHRGNPTGHHK